MDWRDELVSLGDVMEFLEWRKRYRGVPYTTPKSIWEPPPPQLRPVAKLYNSKRRLYSIGLKKGGRSRLSSCMTYRPVSRINAFGFADKSNTFVTVVRRPNEVSGDFVVRIKSPSMDIQITVRRGYVCSVFEDGSSSYQLRGEGN